MPVKDRGGRNARLAAALKENLKRRKLQASKKAQEPGQQPAGAEVSGRRRRPASKISRKDSRNPPQSRVSSAEREGRFDAGWNHPRKEAT
jgi:hypothetical protein